MPVVIVARVRGLVILDIHAQDVACSVYRVWIYHNRLLSLSPLHSSLLTTNWYRRWIGNYVVVVGLLFKKVASSARSHTRIEERASLRLLLLVKEKCSLVVVLLVLCFHKNYRVHRTPPSTMYIQGQRTNYRAAVLELYTPHNNTQLLA